MSEFNSQHNRAVWFDIPVEDLNRAQTFYQAVLEINVARESFNGFEFCVLEHNEGNGGCLIPMPGKAAIDGGIMIYLNVDGRIP